MIKGPGPKLDPFVLRDMPSYLAALASWKF